MFPGGYYLSQPRKPWLVKGVIREGTTVFLSGKEGTGKSLVSLELAYCVAEGRDFFGEAVSEGDVIYVAAERGDNQRERIEALATLKNYKPDSVTFIDEQLKVNVVDDEYRLREKLAEKGLQPKLIIFDTLRASFVGDESSSEVAQATMDAFTRIRRQFDSTILVVHHVNAFGKSRGSSAFIGAADTELYLTESRARTEQKVHLTVRKQNNGRKWLRYTLVAQEIKFEKDYSSIVFNLSDTNEVEESPEEEADSPRRQHILSIIAAQPEAISLYKLVQELMKVEGKHANKESVKRDLIEMHDDGLLIFSESEGKYVIAQAHSD